MPGSTDEAISLAERIFQILDQGRFTATYKYAVLTALLDLCLENVSRTGAAPDVLTTRQLAEKVLELYWPQTRPWSAAGELRQSSGPGGGQAEIVRAIATLRHRVGADRSLPLAQARLAAPDQFEALVRFVEWKLVEMPLPRLQTIGDEVVSFIYTIAWDARIDRREMRRYQETGGGAFDNRIHLRAGVGENLVRLNGLLRPLLQRAWAIKVAELNDREESELERFLFGPERVSLAPVCDPLRDLQDDRCFYCADRLGRSALAPEVDHFIPWARHPDDSLDNLVVAHRRCNGQKRDFLAAADHLARWRVRSRERTVDLDAIGIRLRWQRAIERTTGVARAIYLHLPPGTRLWVTAQHFVALDATAVRTALE
ncbi:MAG TPA: HNH endonuclease domain-containing protein [Candidatus Eisenbacteria bacterium]|nr:HNH endonuclease domain-containing protein [Candidatus Eisenbacteria bacterium]